MDRGGIGAVVVAGSAHLEIVARARFSETGTERSGEVSIDVGGTAFNVAVGMAQAGIPVRFVSAMNESIYNKVVVEHLVAMHVDPYIEYHTQLPTGGVSSHLDTDGKRLAAVVSTPVERVNFSTQRIEAAMAGASMVILDCNLMSLALNRLVTFANERKLPVYVAAVSPERCQRIAGITGRISGIFFTVDEYHKFCEGVRGTILPLGEAAKLLNTVLVVSDGVHTAAIATADGRLHHTMRDVEQSVGGHAAAARDIWMARVLMEHEFRHAAWDDAVRAAWLAWDEWATTPRTSTGSTLETALSGFQYRAGHDAMTGVLNRHSTEQLLNRALERRHKRGATTLLAVLLLDIDHFKSVNDTYGHNVGDEVIVNVTKAAQTCLRETDRLGRWGGEEFIIVVPDTTREVVGQMAERIRQAVAEQVLSPRPITVSIGCSEADGVGPVDLRALVEAADNALYQAKHGGRNRVQYAWATVA